MRKTEMLKSIEMLKKEYHFSPDVDYINARLVQIFLKHINSRSVYAAVNKITEEAEYGSRF